VNPALQGYLAAMEESLSASDALADAGSEAAAVAELVDGNTELTLAINDGSVPVPSRRALLDHLLEGKVRPEVQRLVHQAVTVVPASELTASFHWLASRLTHAASRDGSATTGSGATAGAGSAGSGSAGAGSATGAAAEPEEVLGRMGSRNRVSGYAAAVFETVSVAELEEIEDQLFRFARTVEANRPLRRALGDRDLPVAVRQSVIADLLGTKALPATIRVAAYAVRGGRARDIVATLDALVEDAARTRGWRVARVSSADQVGDDQRRTLSEALAQLAGHPVDLRVTLEPELLGGVVVQIGDLLIDGSTRHRLDQLREHVHASEEAYRVTGSPEGRNTTDG
jgi:F-type H+-transporting ATPase subunit delta